MSHLPHPLDPYTGSSRATNLSSDYNTTRPSSSGQPATPNENYYQNTMSDPSSFQNSDFIPNFGAGSTNMYGESIPEESVDIGLWMADEPTFATGSINPYETATKKKAQGIIDQVNKYLSPALNKRSWSRHQMQSNNEEEDINLQRRKKGTAIPNMPFYLNPLQVTRRLMDSDFEFSMEWCPFYIYEPFKFFPRPWTSCTKQRAEISHIITHMVSDHGIIRGKSSKRKSQRYLTRCNSDDNTRKGKSNCNTCRQVEHWSPEQIKDQRHAGPSLCLRCYTELGTKEDLYGHLHETSICLYHEDFPMIRKSRILYTIFCSATEVPKFNPPPEIRAPMDGARKRNIKGGRRTGTSATVSQNNGQVSTTPLVQASLLQSHYPIPPVVPTLPPISKGGNSELIEDRPGNLFSTTQPTQLRRQPSTQLEQHQQLHGLPDISQPYFFNSNFFDSNFFDSNSFDSNSCDSNSAEDSPGNLISGLQSMSPPAPYTDSGYTSAPATESQYNNLRKPGQQVVTQRQVEQNREDTATEYSTAPSTNLSRQNQYIQELAEDLFSKIDRLNADERTRARVSEILPELLKAFALKFGHGASTQMHRDVMAFVHRHRCAIAAAFTDIGSKQGENLKRSRDNSDSMTLQEVMGLWHEKERFEREPLGIELQGLDLEEIEFQAEDEESENEEVLESWLLAYREFIPSTKAYEWLLARLRREFHLVSTEPNTIRTVRDEIMLSLPSARRISRKTSPQTCSARFELEWDIHKFFETQGYLKQPDQVFERVITLTGSCHDAQAASCAQYIHQTWPLTGGAMIQLIKSVLQGSEGHLQPRKLPDGTTLRAWTTDSKFLVEADGLAISIAEAGEQLSWLGAALRTSPRQSGLMHCTPVITRILQSGATPTQRGPQVLSTDITCEIRFIMEEVPRPASTANGQCWHDIFRNPVVVKGYPILRRIEWGTGLEIPLNIMAGLARAQRIDRFNEKVYIKGFSTMLVPTKRNGDILCWHLIYKMDGSRISFLDNHVDQEQGISLLDVENFRHVLGWCSEARFYAGSAEAHYPVSQSGLPKPHAGCVLAKTSVSSGRIIMGGLAFDIGLKDTPIQVSRNGYIPRLKWISTKFVLLWDERDKRGWLINGTSALLHIVRASLAHDAKDKFRSVFLFKSEDLQESPKPFTADSAIDVLVNSKNLGLKLYPEKDNFILLESRIDQIYNVLEKLIDHQMDIAGDSGANLSDKPRRYLEGWEFEDLATNRDPLYPRMATIDAAGKGWIDFTRAIRAVTLIGRGFGDIIRPAGANVCEYWVELPRQQYYLASCLSDLDEVIKEHRSCRDGHIRLGDNLIWHTPTTIFGSCRCKGTLSQDRCEPVQTLFPSALSEKLLARRHPIQLDGHGAVVFGYNSNFSWVWGDTGRPQEGKLGEAMSSPDAIEVDSESFKDSGIGSSLVWSGSDDRSSSQLRPHTHRLMTSPNEFRTAVTTLNSVPCADGEIYARRHYTVGILCALPKELMAVRALFDRKHDSLESSLDDSNQYALSQMGQHMIVGACLPAGECGTNSAATVASNMVRSFPSIRFCLLVGIGGGAPSEENDIRLGDVVVSLPTSTFPGVIQYDLGKEKEGCPFELTGTLQRPPRVLATAISILRSDPDLGPEPLGPHLRKIATRMPRYGHPGQELDVLLQTGCAACRSQKECPSGGSHIRHRVPRATVEPEIHYGLVASGNRVIKDAAFRDRLAREYGVLCFEMEAAGVINTVDCLVIRGICDYCDAQKDDTWQEYAASTAAAYAKLLLGVVPSVDDVGCRGGSFPENSRRSQKRHAEEGWEHPCRGRKL